MLWRRIAYLATLLAAFLYHVFHTRYFSWLLLLLVILLPLLSVLISLPLMLGYRLSLRFADTQEGGCEVTVSVTPPPLTRVRLRLRLENLFNGQVEAHPVVIRPGKGDTATKPIGREGSCGVVRCQVKRPYTLDVLGLIALPLHRAEPVQTLIPPKERTFAVSAEQMPGESQMSAPIFTGGQSGERELQDVRDYRAGDLLSDVHWKLTARRSQLVVKEFDRQAGSSLYVALPWVGSAQELQKSLGRLIGIHRFLTAHSLPYKILWARVRENGALDISVHALEETDSMEQFLQLALSGQPHMGSPLPADALLTHELVDRRPVWLVRPDGIFLCQDGGQREICP